MSVGIITESRVSIDVPVNRMKKREKNESDKCVPRGGHAKCLPKFDFAFTSREKEMSPLTVMLSLTVSAENVRSRESVVDQEFLSSFFSTSHTLVQSLPLSVFSSVDAR